jgi:hypothetical protein
MLNQDILYVFIKLIMLQVRRVGENHGGTVHTVLVRSAILCAQRDSVGSTGAMAAQAPTKQHVFRGQQNYNLRRGCDHHRRQHHVYGYRSHHDQCHVYGREKETRNRIQPAGQTHGRSVLCNEGLHDPGNR